MKLAIMQPYFFPYIGYFQLISAVQKFVIYDDVNFIKGGWINRNRILENGKPGYINIEMQQPSPNKKINEVGISIETHWKKKLLKKIEFNYRRRPFFNESYFIIEEVLTCDSNNLSQFITNSIIKISQFLDIKTEIVKTSQVYNNQHLSGEARVLDICVKEGAGVYINPIGGLELYKKSSFRDRGVDIFFLKSHIIEYDQFGRDSLFYPHLSIIDVLMCCGKNRTKEFLSRFELIPGH